MPAPAVRWFDVCDGCEVETYLFPRPRRYHGTPPASWRRNNFYCADCLNGDPKRTADPIFYVFDGPHDGRADLAAADAQGPSMRSDLAAAAWLVAFGALVIGLVGVYVVGITTVARWVLQGA